MMKDMNDQALFALRSAIMSAIHTLEEALKREPVKGLSVEATAYFKQQHLEQLAAIPQLKTLAGQLWTAALDRRAMPSD